MKWPALLICVVTLAGVLGQPVSARDRERPRDRIPDDRPRREQRELQPQGETQQRETREPTPRDPPRTSPETAARQAQQQNGGGRVLSVDRGENGYRVKLLKDGEVRSYLIADE
ncbi:MAG: hypothetical protein L0Y32_05175 [Nevskiales bacterium]|nr:hypothetical protein [Nevskiales bacterium]